MKARDAAFAQASRTVREDGIPGSGVVPTGLHGYQANLAVGSVTLTPPEDAVMLQLYVSQTVYYTMDGVTAPSATGAPKGMYLPSNTVREIRFVPGQPVLVAIGTANTTLNYQWYTGV